MNKSSKKYVYLKDAIIVGVIECKHAVGGDCYILIFLQDFALDPEETRMRAAAHHMIRNMTSALALITSREPLYHSIASNLRSAFMNSLRLTAEVWSQPSTRVLLNSAINRICFKRLRNTLYVVDDRHFSN